MTAGGDTADGGGKEKAVGGGARFGRSITCPYFC